VILTPRVSYRTAGAGHALCLRRCTASSHTRQIRLCACAANTVHLCHSPARTSTLLSKRDYCWLTMLALLQSEVVADADALLLKDAHEFPRCATTTHRSSGTVARPTCAVNGPCYASQGRARRACASGSAPPARNCSAAYRLHSHWHSDAARLGRDLLQLPKSLPPLNCLETGASWIEMCRGVSLRRDQRTRVCPPVMRTRSQTMARRRRIPTAGRPMPSHHLHRCCGTALCISVLPVSVYAVADSKRLQGWRSQHSDNLLAALHEALLQHDSARAAGAAATLLLVHVRPPSLLCTCTI